MIKFPLSVTTGPARSEYDCQATRNINLNLPFITAIRNAAFGDPRLWCKS